MPGAANDYWPTFLLPGAGQFTLPLKCEYDNMHNGVLHNTANSIDMTVLTYLAPGGGHPMWPANRR